MNAPFTISQFFNVFEKYNTLVFPFQIVIFLLGIVAFFALYSNKKSMKKYILFFLAFLWIWIGVVYHFLFFSEINKAAFVFGSLFIIQGLMFFIIAFSKKEFTFTVKPGIFNYLAYFFIIFSLIIYPVIGYCIEGSIYKVISIGLPCPSTIFTIGMIMLAAPKLPKYLIIIPSLWSLVGLSAALNFGVYQDFMMIFAAIIAIVYFFRNNKYK